jgi:hypothetical protein
VRIVWTLPWHQGDCWCRINQCIGGFPVGERGNPVRSFLTRSSSLVCGTRVRSSRASAWASLCAWVAATFLATLLAANTVWPWYVVWILPSLALVLDPLLIVLALPLIVLKPFLPIMYRSEYLPNGAATMLLYAATGAVWLIMLLRTKRTS